MSDNTGMRWDIEYTRKALGYQPQADVPRFRFGVRDGRHAAPNRLLKFFEPGAERPARRPAVHESQRVGLRVGAGYWLDSERTFGVDVGFSVLESQATIFSASSSGTPDNFISSNAITIGANSAIQPQAGAPGGAIASGR